MEIINRVRQCYACGSADSINTTTGYPSWYRNYDAEDNVLCTSCRSIFIHKSNESVKKFYRNNPKKIEENRNKSRQAWQNLRLQLIMILGGPRCQSVECRVPGGMDDIDCLQLDHIHGDGKQDRATMARVVFLRFYIRNPQLARQRLQVLCSNCNSKKRVVKKEGPHQYKT